MCSPEVMSRVHASLRRTGSSARTRRQFLGRAGAVAAAGALVPFAVAAQDATPIASPITDARTITFSTVANLSHSLTPDAPVWPGRDPFEVEVATTVAADGFYGQILRFHEHVGTHLDAPAHFVDGGAFAGDINPANLVAPLVVLDVTAQAEADPDYAVTVDDVLAWESEYGPLPAGAFVAFDSGWSERFFTPDEFVNLDADGVQHYPGFHPDTAAFLVDERAIVGIGTDTLSQDPGNSTDFGTHVTILGAGLYGIEGISFLETVPASGATVVVGGPNHIDASGGPARLLALI